MACKLKENDMPGEWQTALHFIAERFNNLDTQIKEIHDEALASQLYAKESRDKLLYLNDWHNRVTGALWIIGILTSATFAAALVVLGAIINR